MIYFFERKSWMIIHEFMIEAMGGKTISFNVMVFPQQWCFCCSVKLCYGGRVSPMCVFVCVCVWGSMDSNIGF